MSRPISWFPRVRELHRSVCNSVRSHYDRRDLEQLFELQPRSAQKLLELLPRTAIGQAMVVDREHLQTFLERVKATAERDVPKLLETIRSEKPVVTRKKLRTLELRDLDPISLASLPRQVKLSRGNVNVSFDTIEELVQFLFTLARILDGDSNAFADRYERHRSRPVVYDEVPDMLEELVAMEKAHAASTDQHA